VLAELTGPRRFTRRRERQQAEQRLDRAMGAEHGAESVLDMIGQRRVRLNEELVEWKAWAAEHGNEVNRLREVDSLIAEYGRHHQSSVERHLGMRRDTGRDMGIDLGP
jgi:hypothetical protein